MAPDDEWPIPPLRPKDYPLLLELLGREAFEQALRRDAAYRTPQQGGEPLDDALERPRGC